jgi:hypothetical protein
LEHRQCDYQFKTLIRFSAAGADFSLRPEFSESSVAMKFGYGWRTASVKGLFRGHRLSTSMRFGGCTAFVAQGAARVER